MRFMECGRPVPAAAAVAASVLWLAAALDAAPAAEDKTYVMKITLPTLNDTVHQLAKNYARSGREGFGRSHQGRGLSREPTRPDRAADRRRAVRRDPVRGHSARVF